MTMRRVSKIFWSFNPLELALLIDPKRKTKKSICHQGKMSLSYFQILEL